MSNNVRRLPPAINEPIRSYAPGSAERADLKARLTAMEAESPEIPLVVGGKPIASWVPYTIFGFEVMVLFGGLATVAGLLIHARIPRLTLQVGYDPRFSAGDYGVWVETTSDRADEAMDLLRRHGAREVRSER